MDKYIKKINNLKIKCASVIEVIKEEGFIDKIESLKQSSAGSGVPDNEIHKIEKAFPEFHTAFINSKNEFRSILEAILSTNKNKSLEELQASLENIKIILPGEISDKHVSTSSMPVVLSMESVSKGLENILALLERAEDIIPEV